MFDTDSPLNRIANESKAANKALVDLALMGETGSIRKLCERYIQQVSSNPLAEKPPTTKLNTLFTWSNKNEWVKRIARFRELEQEARLAERERRRQELEENDYKLGMKLRQRAEELLDLLPKFTTKTETVNVEETIDPVTGDRVRVVTRVVTTKLNTNVSQLAQAIKAASELQRLATDSATQKIDHTGIVIQYVNDWRNNPETDD